MRILLVTHRYPPFGLAGVERLSEQTAMALTSAGNDVTVLTKRESAAPPMPRMERTVRHGIKIVMLSGGGSLHGRFPDLAPRLERLFERTVLEVEPDVVLISHLLGHSPNYVSIAHRWGVPVVLELHDFYAACERVHLERRSGGLCNGPEGGRACAAHCFPDDPRALQRWALRTHLFRCALEQADALTAPSQFVADYFRQTVGIATPMHVIGNGVRVADHRSPPPRGSENEPLHIACIGVVIPHKGPHVVLEALRLARLPAARFTLFGALTQPYFRELLRTADAIDTLAFRAYGPFEPSELPFLLADVDAVIIPSLVWETYSITTREAMACGVPVIASRSGALPEAVRQEENGLLFTPGSAVELAAILHLLDGDRELLKALRAGIRPTDCPPARDRMRRLEAVLTDVSAGDDVVTAHELDELTILRDALLQEPAAT
jgi:glycosyltransferase involved in cell wall biosynthesis